MTKSRRSEIIMMAHGWTALPRVSAVCVAHPKVIADQLRRI